MLELKNFCLRSLIFGLSLACVAVANAQGDVLARVKSQGVVHCGSVARPGLAEPNPDRSDPFAPSGEWFGLNVEICRAIAVAVLGTSGRFEFRSYDTRRDFDAVRTQEDDIFFLTGSDIVEQDLGGALLPGPSVYYETRAVLVPEISAVKRLEDLKGAKVCFVNGTSTQRSLEAYFEAKHIAFARLGFTQPDDMFAAYQAGQCDAVADETTALAKSQLHRHVQAIPSRILAQPLAAFPIMATTSAADANWAAIVSWAIHSLMRDEIREGRWLADGASAPPIEASYLGLGLGWQRRMIEALGTYADIFSRTLGAKSIYGEARGLSVRSRDAGLFLSPYAD